MFTQDIRVDCYKDMDMEIDVCGLEEEEEDRSTTSSPLSEDRSTTSSPFSEARYFDKPKVLLLNKVRHRRLQSL